MNESRRTEVAEKRTYFSRIRRTFRAAPTSSNSFPSAPQGSAIALAIREIWRTAAIMTSMALPITSEILDATEHLPEGATLVIPQVTWDDYEHLLDDLTERPHLRVSYD